jgi:hypothetical protein
VAATPTTRVATVHGTTVATGAFLLDWERPAPSQRRGIDPGTPLVVDVRPETLAEPYFQARFAALGKDRGTAPQLRWRVTRGC